MFKHIFIYKNIEIGELKNNVLDEYDYKQFFEKNKNFKMVECTIVFTPTEDYGLKWW